jgi:hypothetical protein
MRVFEFLLLVLEYSLRVFKCLVRVFKYLVRVLVYCLCVHNFVHFRRPYSRAAHHNMSNLPNSTILHEVLWNNTIKNNLLKYFDFASIFSS